MPTRRLFGDYFGVSGSLYAYIQRRCCPYGSRNQRPWKSIDLCLKIVHNYSTFCVVSNHQQERMAIPPLQPSHQLENTSTTRHKTMQISRTTNNIPRNIDAGSRTNNPPSTRPTEPAVQVHGRYICFHRPSQNSSITQYKYPAIKEELPSTKDSQASRGRRNSGRYRRFLRFSSQT